MSKRDFYKVLDVAKGADEAAIKKAYRRLAMKHHPDRNPDDAESETKFKEAKEAYEILSDSQKRAAYDQYGHAGVEGAAGGMGGGAGSFGDRFGDVFGDIFGGGRPSSGGAYRGADMRYDLVLGLEEAVMGHSANITFSSLKSCETCDGDGAKPGTEKKQCTTCGGIGQVRRQQGFFSVQQTCPSCRGEGRTIEDPCNDCHARGGYSKAAHLRSRFLPAWIRVTGSAYQAKVRPGKTVGHPVICTSKFGCDRMRYLNATVLTFLVMFRFPLPLPHSAVKPRCPRWKERLV